MRILFTSLREQSHFMPLVPFIEACKNAGHEVAVGAPPDLAERVARLGVQFFPFGHPGDAGLMPIWAKLRTAAPGEAEKIVIGEIFAGVCASSALPALIETLQQWKPSIVVRESQEYAAVIAARKLGIPHARAAIMLRSVELGMAETAQASLEAHARNFGLTDADPRWVREEPSITQFPAAFDATGAGLASVHRFRSPKKAAGVLPDWWPGRTEPFVYLTLGTVVGKVETQRGGYARALAAVGGVPARVLFTIGNDTPMEALGEIPSNVHVERFVPQDDILPHAAAVLCHGGSGTVIGTLAAGVPQVVAPMGADQPYNAARIGEVGAGIGLSLGWTSDDLRSALYRVLEEAPLRTKAQRIASEIAALPPMSEAGAVLQQLAAAGVAAR